MPAAAVSVGYTTAVVSDGAAAADSVGSRKQREEEEEEVNGALHVPLHYSRYSVLRRRKRRCRRRPDSSVITARLTRLTPAPLPCPADPGWLAGRLHSSVGELRPRCTPEASGESWTVNGAVRAAGRGACSWRPETGFSKPELWRWLAIRWLQTVGSVAVDGWGAE